jgi:uncharacterized protein (DUF2252 family)
MSRGDPAREAHERGRAARSDVPRSSLAEVGTPADRDPVAILAAQGEDRTQALLPIRYGRMLISPFSFFRGAAAVMAADLAAAPRTPLTAQLCGDAHLSNFGAFASTERRLVFDLNDFDETLPGPFEWDVKRLVASLEVAGREIGVKAAKRRDVVAACAREYRDAMAGFADRDELEVWYARVEVDDLIDETGLSGDRKLERRLQKGAARARARDNVQAFAKFTTEGDEGARIVRDPPLIVPVAELAADLAPEEITRRVTSILERYATSLVSDRRHLLERFRPVDVAHKVVGVGSVGTRCWIALMEGVDRGDPLFLQVKEATASVLEPYCGASEYGTAGERVVAGQRLMQATSDIFLGWTGAIDPEGRRRDYYVRQLRDWKGSVDLERATPRTLRAYGEVCGWTLARAHARSGERFAISGYLGKGDGFERAMTGFAEAYAERNQADHAALRAAVAEGRIEAAEGI